MAWYASVMSEYASVWLNVPQYGWLWLNLAECSRVCLNKLLWQCEGSQYASSSYIFDRVLNMPQILDMPGFWICRDIVIITSFLL